MKTYDTLYINGTWQEGHSQHTLTNTNPFTDEALYSYRAADTTDVDAAYEAAKAAQPKWEALPPREKQQYMMRLYEAIMANKEEILAVLREEGGSTVVKAEAEFQFLADVARNAITFPVQMHGRIMPSNNNQENYVFKQAKGVISVIAPWNFPFDLSACAVIPAVATGNAVVLKPATDTPASAALLCALFDEAGFPAGVVNYVAGKGSEIGDYFVTHPLSDFVYFTGSTAVGRHIAGLASREIKEISLELGGNNAMLVLGDADIEKAVQVGLTSAYFNQGQVCMSLNRIIVVKEKYDAFVDAFTKAVQQIPYGDPADPKMLVGPSINGGQAQSVMDLMEATVEAGAKVAVRGERHGNVVSPWLLVDCTNDMPACRQEIFGPAVCVIKADNEEEAIAIANDTEYGLRNTLITEDVYHGLEVARQIHTGMSHVNSPSVQDEAHVMFGGMKQSGLGRTNGEWVIEKFTEERWISVNR
ncbi:aldehyde dehydrogenase family protein [Veillonella magna]|uniref:aldehyde dehydrogenase family protein n=1 Tax=Veillonella magna TaxID=464322 RepID=UPI002664F2D0|nr:aldehyde dehydrogenase family protein [Veillonella magna]